MNEHLKGVLDRVAASHDAVIRQEAYSTEQGLPGNHFCAHYFPEDDIEGRVVILDARALVKENGTIIFGFMPPLVYASMTLEDQVKGHVAHDLNELTQQQATVVVAIHDAINASAREFFDGRGVNAEVHPWEPSQVNTDRAILGTPAAEGAQSFDEDDELKHPKLEALVQDIQSKLEKSLPSVCDTTTLEYFPEITDERQAEFLLSQDVPGHSMFASQAIYLSMEGDDRLSIATETPWLAAPGWEYVCPLKKSNVLTADLAESVTRLHDAATFHIKKLAEAHGFEVALDLDPMDLEAVQKKRSSAEREATKLTRPRVSEASATETEPVGLSIGRR